jgi:hypothetical protein
MPCGLQITIRQTQPRGARRKRTGRCNPANQDQRDCLHYTGEIYDGLPGNPGGRPPKSRWDAPVMALKQ